MGILNYNKNSIKNLAISASKRHQYELDKTLLLNEFIDSLISDSKKNEPSFHGSNTLYKEPYPRTVRVAPSIAEMNDIILALNSELKSIDSSDLGTEEKLNKKRDLLRENVKPKQIVTLESRPDIWWGDTLKGINGRVGYVGNDRSKSFPFKIGGKQAQACAGGNTGEGKSVMMDAFIMSLLTEYPPWEISIFLIDMKMLEHAKYGQGNKCPQIRDIGITGSSTYITSVLEFIDNEEKQLYNLASLCGVNNLEGFRNLLDLHIPSTIVIMDEFGQLKKNGTNKECTEVEFRLQSIANLGRAMHYHMLPTTQNFKGTIDSTTLGQFKVGMCVGANDDNSENIIGNTGAVPLKKKLGYCIVNQNRNTKDFKANIEYKVAFEDVEKSEGMVRFQEMLERVCKQAELLDIKDRPTMFNEKTQSDYESLESDYNRVKTENESIFARILLGIGTVYSGKNLPTLEYIDLTYTRNCNIFIHSLRNYDEKYLLSLVCDSIKMNFKDTELPNIKMIIDNQEIYKKNLFDNYKEDLTGLFNLSGYLEAVLDRESFLRFNLLMESVEQEPTIYNYIKYLASNNKLPEVLKSNIDLSELEKWYDDEYLELQEVYMNNIAKEDYKGESKITRELLNNNGACNEILKSYNRYMNFMTNKKDKYFRANDFKNNILFFFEPQLNDGVSNKYGINETFYTLLKKGPSVGLFSIVVMKEPKGQTQLIKCCKHILTGSISSSLENTGLVTFLDKSGINMKYTESDGDEKNNKYFKKYLKFNNISEP